MLMLMMLPSELLQGIKITKLAYLFLAGIYFGLMNPA